VLVLDESGQVKQGDRTAGVKPQYVGCAGRVTNAINFVNATYSTARGHTLIGSRLRVPDEQLADAYIRDRMGIPGHLEPATKPQLGAQMLAGMPDAGIEIPWLAADEVYGQDPGLRELCEERGVGYVLGVACSFRLTLPSGARIRADKILAKIPGRAWTILDEAHAAGEPLAYPSREIAGVRQRHPPRNSENGTKRWAVICVPDER